MTAKKLVVVAVVKGVEAIAATYTPLEKLVLGEKAKPAPGDRAGCNHCGGDGCKFMLA